MTRILASLIISALCLTACGGESTTNTPGESEPTPGDAVEAFARAMEAGDVQAIKSLCPDFEENLTASEIADLAGRAAGSARAAGGIETITIDSESVDGDTATVTATLTNGNGASSTETLKLNRLDGKWTIDRSEAFRRLEANSTDEPAP
ncbi:MAG: DUF4878 domain-containing protein [Planctomycetota bacterium]